MRCKIRGLNTKVWAPASAPGSQGKPTADTMDVKVQIQQEMHNVMGNMANLEFRVSQRENHNDARGDLGSAVLVDLPEPGGSDL